MFPDDQPLEVKQVICGIMEHLIENPEAKDTLDGIERWWFGSLSLAPSRRTVERAIDALVAAGWLRTMVDTRVVYLASDEGLGSGKRWLDRRAREQE